MLMSFPESDGKFGEAEPSGKLLIQIAKLQPHVTADGQPELLSQAGEPILLLLPSAGVAVGIAAAEIQFTCRRRLP